MDRKSGLTGTPARQQKAEIEQVLQRYVDHL
jgi:hypothetical protein